MKTNLNARKDISQTRTEPEFLVSWTRWYGWVILTLGLFFFIVFAVRRSPASIFFGIFLSLIAFPVIRYGLQKAIHGRVIPALIIVTVTIWIIGFAIAARGLTALPVAIPLTMIPMILALPYVSAGKLFKLAVGTIVICTLEFALTLNGSLMPSTLSEGTLAVLVLPVTSITAGMAILALWHVGSRLRNSLLKTKEAERSLERKVKERTEELEGALAEISDIQGIAHMVNTTLDLDQVISTMHSALQRIVNFNKLSVFLVDRDRQRLLMNRLSGVDFSPEAKERLTQEGFPMSEERSMLVSAVLSGEPRFMSDIGPKVLPNMTPTDRWFYNLNPMKSLLVCPLEIEGAVIGAVGFANTHESVVLDEQEIDRIQRYVTPLSTVIRNARLYEETKAARAVAIETNEAKSQFLANISHELRTPLNAIIGYSEMLQEEAEEADLDEFIPDLDKIHNSGYYLLELINSVLDLSKIEAGKMEIHSERFGVSDLLREVVATAEPLVKTNSNQLEVAAFNALGEMHSDTTMIRQVLLNLLSNASKFTKNGSIRFAVERQPGEGGDWMSFAVTDSGIGMTEEQCERIFNAFTQADGSTTRQYGGTGLGLTISKQFCEMMGGSIEVESEPGSGSTFTMHLPVQAPELEP